MTYDEYADLAAEMNIIFRYIDDDLVEKIPRKIVEFFQDIASPNFKSKIDPRFPLDEQELLPSTECMLTLLYRQYWCSDAEKEQLDKLIIEQAELQEKRDQASFNNLFDKINNDSDDLFIEDIENTESNATSNLPSVINKDFIVEKIKQLRDFIIKIFNEIFKKQK